MHSGIVDAVLLEEHTIGWLLTQKQGYLYVKVVPRLKLCGTLDTISSLGVRAGFLRGAHLCQACRASLLLPLQ